jgi:hypothetical protein
MAMRQIFVRSDLVAMAWAGPDHARIDQENREPLDVITATEEAVAAAARVRARYREDLAHRGGCAASPLGLLCGGGR